MVGRLAAIAAITGVAIGALGSTTALAASGPVGMPYGKTGTTYSTLVHNPDVVCFTDHPFPTDVSNVGQPTIGAGFNGQRVDFWRILWKWNGSKWTLYGARQQSLHYITGYGLKIQPSDFYNVSSGYYAMSYLAEWFATNGTTLIGYKHFAVGGYEQVRSGFANWHNVNTPYCQVYSS